MQALSITIDIPEFVLELHWLEFIVERFALSLACGCLILRLLVCKKIS